MQKEVCINYDMLKKLSVLYSKISSDIKDINSNIEKQISNLDWSVKEQGNIEFNLRGLKKKVQSFEKYGEEISKYISLTLTTFSNTDQSASSKLEKENNFINGQIEMTAQKELMSGMTHKEILNYRHDNAVEPEVKKLYDQYKSGIDINNKKYKGTAHYNTFWNEINYNEANDTKDPRGPGSVYYHEVGHLIDDKSDWNGDTSTDNDYKFSEKLGSDYNNYVKKVMEEQGYTKKEDAYNYINTWLWDSPDSKSGVSDIMNGLSNGKCCGRWAHDSSYYSDDSIANESFAHFFEAGMEASPEKLNYIKEVFPSAYEEFIKMVKKENK
jgi:uncharacterized protein YukE